MMKKHRRAIVKRQDAFFKKKGEKLELQIIDLKEKLSVQKGVIVHLKDQLERSAKENFKLKKAKKHGKI